MTHRINLIKLSVGTESVEDLLAWQKSAQVCGEDGNPRHVTRMWPKRADELLNGGSIYWVIKGQIQCRQLVLRLDQVTGSDGINRCAMVLDPVLIRTQTALRRPFQGWRYLQQSDAPPDLRASRADDDVLPSDLNRALAEIGLI
ncbi:DUF1489 family protein [Pontibaca salina]|uniref:DUF1489 domain-containing protein n=1 Tax=Pontibaca salina TaxID=2795731 RepID=A0A934HRU1_9RHOB|nr:DUF1489 domain-containing protein [Pontibaca salina]MBI6629721.1 DUF1489 domain-containing protein [Pontibaca salina]